jgi:hypothetical protein
LSGKAFIFGFEGGEEQSERQHLFNLTMTVFMRKSAFRASASAFQLQQQQMEMGISPFLPDFPCFLFFNHHHFLTSTSTKKPSLPKNNYGFVSNNSNNVCIDDALASFYRMVRINPRPSVVEFGKFLGSFAKKKTVLYCCLFVQSNGFVSSHPQCLFSKYID